MYARKHSTKPKKRVTDHVTVGVFVRVSRSAHWILERLEIESGMENSLRNHKSSGSLISQLESLFYSVIPLKFALF